MMMMMMMKSYDENDCRRWPVQAGRAGVSPDGMIGGYHQSHQNHQNHCQCQNHQIMIGHNHQNHERG